MNLYSKPITCYMLNSHVWYFNIRFTSPIAISIITMFHMPFRPPFPFSLPTHYPMIIMAHFILI